MNCFGCGKKLQRVKRGRKRSFCDDCVNLRARFQARGNYRSTVKGMKVVIER
jgi:hypothetical protein